MIIYVGNLSLDITEEELRCAFLTYGQVVSVVIMNDKYIGSGQTRGYGYVEMTSKSDGVAAITALNGMMLRSRAIDAVEALPLSDKNNAGFTRMRYAPFNKKVRQRKILNTK